MGPVPLKSKEIEVERQLKQTLIDDAEGYKKK
jgi:hypothetical protein